MTLTERIRVLSDKAPSESAFARQCGISKQLLRRYLHEGTTPGADKLMAIARAGGVSAAWLLTGLEERTEGARSSEITPPALSRSSTEEIRAQDIPLRRFLEAISEAWKDPEMRGWLGPTIARWERELDSTFPELAEKKSATSKSGDGAA